MHQGHSQSLDTFLPSLFNHITVEEVKPSIFCMHGLVHMLGSWDNIISWGSQYPKMKPVADTSSGHRLHDVI